MDYQSYQPSDPLTSLVKCYWTLEGPKTDIPQKQRIVPDGCMEMIFHYGDLYKQYLPDGEAIMQPRCFVFGQITTNLDIEATGVTGIFAVRFHPDGFTPFASTSIKEMNNRAVPLLELFGSEAASFERNMLESTTTQERIKVVNQFLLKRLTEPETIDKLVKSTVETMFTIEGHPTIATLTQEMKIHRRDLERRFAKQVGISPKQLFKIIRLQAAFKSLLAAQSKSLTAIAYEGNYYDQAHFIKDFKEFTGLSPKQFYADNLKMSSLFYRDEL